jgi:putative SOS response-associated peptidase YedK
VSYFLTDNVAIQLTLSALGIENDYTLPKDMQTSPTIPVIRPSQGRQRLQALGIDPDWAKDPSIGNRMINARAETLTELPSFKLLVNRYVSFCTPYLFRNCFRNQFPPFSVPLRTA